MKKIIKGSHIFNIENSKKKKTAIKKKKIIY